MKTGGLCRALCSHAYDSLYPLLSALNPSLKGYPSPSRRITFSSRRSVVIQDAGRSRVNPLIHIKNNFFLAFCLSSWIPQSTWPLRKKRGGSTLGAKCISQDWGQNTSLSNTPGLIKWWTYSNSTHQQLQDNMHYSHFIHNRLELFSYYLTAKLLSPSIRAQLDQMLTVKQKKPPWLEDKN